MRFHIKHTTRYIYPGQVCDNHNELRLMPVSDERQTCTEFRIDTVPPARIFSYELPHGRVHHFNIRSPHSELTVTATSRVVTQAFDPFAALPSGDGDAEFYGSEDTRADYAEYLMPTARVPLDVDVDAFAEIALAARDAADTGSYLVTLTRVLHRVLEYRQGTTDVDTPLGEVVKTKQGVCQDFAHLMLSICRRSGIPARYVSGYVYTGGDYSQGRDALPDVAERRLEERGLQRQNKLLGDRSGTLHLIDGGAMHAWVECLLPDGQWHGFDPTNCLLTNELYVRVHTGRDYGDVPPLRGVYAGPRATKLEVSVSVVSEN